MSEKSFEAGVVKALEVLGYHVDQFSQRRRGECRNCGSSVYAGTQQTLGIPDLRARHKTGIGVWLEIKWGKGKLSSDQLVWLERELAAGGCCAPIWSVEDLAYVMHHATDHRFELPAEDQVSRVTRTYVLSWRATSRQVPEPS